MFIHTYWKHSKCQPCRASQILDGACSATPSSRNFISARQHTRWHGGGKTARRKEQKKSFESLLSSRFKYHESCFISAAHSIKGAYPKATLSPDRLRANIYLSAYRRWNHGHQRHSVSLDNERQQQRAPQVSGSLGKRTGNMSPAERMTGLLSVRQPSNGFHWNGIQLASFHQPANPSPPTQIN